MLYNTLAFLFDRSRDSWFNPCRSNPMSPHLPALTRTVLFARRELPLLASRGIHAPILPLLDVHGDQQKITPLKNSPNNIGSIVYKPISKDGTANKANGTHTTAGDSCGFSPGAAAVMIVMASIVTMMCMTEVLFAVEDQEIHTERIECRHKHACQDSELCETRTRQMSP